MTLEARVALLERLVALDMCMHGKQHAAETRNRWGGTLWGVVASKHRGRVSDRARLLRELGSPEQTDSKEG